MKTSSGDLEHLNHVIYFLVVFQRYIQQLSALFWLGTFWLRAWLMQITGWCRWWWSLPGERWTMGESCRSSIWLSLGASQFFSTDPNGHAEDFCRSLSLRLLRVCSRNLRCCHLGHFRNNSSPPVSDLIRLDIFVAISLMTRMWNARRFHETAEVLLTLHFRVVNCLRCQMMGFCMETLRLRSSGKINERVSESTWRE